MNGARASTPARQGEKPRLRAEVVNSRLRVGSFARPGDAVTLTQCDATTCGATCVLAARLMRGMVPRALEDAAAEAMPGRRLTAELGAEQRRLQRGMNRRGLGPVPWPGALGSTPWAVARAMTRSADGRAAYTVRRVNDRPPAWDEEVEALRAHLAAGAEVVVLTGGPLAPPSAGAGPVLRLGRALAATPAIPRHYVLALPWGLMGRPDPGRGRAPIYEPGSGTVVVADLLADRDPRGPGPREFGGWPRVLAVIAPR